MDTEEMVVDTGVDNLTGSESTEPAAHAEGKDDVTKAFSARLNQEKGKMEKEYAPYKKVLEAQAKKANMSVEKYIEYVEQKQTEEALAAEAKETGKSPEVLKVEKAKSEAEARLAQYELKDRLTSEETELIKDETIGPFVSDNLAEIRKIAESTGTNLRTGLALVAANKLPELLAAANPDAHIQKYLKDLKSGKKPVEIGGGASAAPGAKPVKSFDDAKASALSRFK